MSKIVRKTAERSNFIDTLYKKNAIVNIAATATIVDCNKQLTGWSTQEVKVSERSEIKNKGSTK